ncbi:MAG TPA: PAC2 family protein [Acidimicrobiales bacterium]|nr:PAC2 family protein [Acidimicrobiales bacterium]
MALYSQLAEVSYPDPVLVLCLDGWIDAGLGAAAALATIINGRESERVAIWDADEVIDHRARRPVLHLADGVATAITWPEVELRAMLDDRGQGFLVLMGPEPDMKWHAFCRSVVELATACSVRQAIGIGAFPAPVPHTRPVRLVATAPTATAAAEVGFVPGKIDVPAGAQAVLEHELNRAGISSVGLWARVPHYVVSMPYPAASAALIDGLGSVAGLALPSAELHEAATRTRARIDELIAASDEHRVMVSQLESQVDSVEGIDRLPSGDEIAAELERFLRGDAGQ